MTDEAIEHQDRVFAVSGLKANRCCIGIGLIVLDAEAIAELHQELFAGVIKEALVSECPAKHIAGAIGKRGVEATEIGRRKVDPRPAEGATSNLENTATVTLPEGATDPDLNLGPPGTSLQMAQDSIQAQLDQWAAEGEHLMSVFHCS